MKESDLTAFLLIFDRRVYTYHNKRYPGDWEYISSDGCTYSVDNYHEQSYIFKFTADEREKLHDKLGHYKEQEALEIVVTHWLENERI